MFHTFFCVLSNIVNNALRWMFQIYDMIVEKFITLHEYDAIMMHVWFMINYKNTDEELEVRPNSQAGKIGGLR